MLLLLLIFSIVLLVLPQPLILGQEIVTVEVVVREHGTGNPIPHAKILATDSYYWMVSIYSQKWLGEADSKGHFLLELPAKRRGHYIIYAYYNDSLTPGFDYVPSAKLLQDPSGIYNLTFELLEGASMFLEGEALLVETTETPRTYYSVLEPDSGEFLKYGEYTFTYGEGSSHYQIPGVNSNHIIVPADTPFKVKVDSQIEGGGDRLTRSFIIDKPGHFVLGRGEAVHVDLREYSLHLSLSVVRAETSDIGLMLDEREEEGFYLAVERQRFAQITSLILEAENYLSRGAYETCLSRLRHAHIEISNLHNWLNTLYREASTSVFLLIAFVALTAMTTSHLLFEEKLHKILGASAFYALFLLTLYLLFPGSRLVEFSSFLGASLISFVSVLGFAALVPRILKGREIRGRVPLRNLIVPVFSIAKRSLMRRRLRSTFTFITVMILVSSFITLTSMATGFGLTFRRISSQPASSSGVLVRAPKTLALPEHPGASHLPGTPFVRGPEPVDVFWYPPLDNSTIGWFEERPDSVHVAPKYENLPRSEYMGSPVGSVEGHSIWGIIGVVPSTEAEVLPWNETIVEGRFLRDGDENGVLISTKIKEKLNTTVGENLNLWTLNKILRLEIIGIFDDAKFESLRDLDGESLLPWKIKIELFEENKETGEHLVYLELTPCSTDETLLVTWRTTTEFDKIYLSRLNIKCKEGEDLAEYAKTMALNKGFRVWASTEEGIYLAQLSSYFEGKGLPLAVPWGIVVLNVVVTMLNSLYERRREIYVYSAVGMKPSHIAGAFLAEVAVIGVVGGGVGYLVGLGWYKVMGYLALGIQVKQKVSALWVLAAIAISMAAVLTGGIAAIKGSVVVTPSLMRRWRIEKEPVTSAEFQELVLPIRVSEVEAESFVEYVVKRLRSIRDDLDFVTDGIRERVEEKEDKIARVIEFIYRHTVNAKGLYSRNKVILTMERGKDTYTVELLTKGNITRRVGSLIREIIMGWNIERGKRAVLK